jgi:hypothetical protein
MLLKDNSQIPQQDVLQVLYDNTPETEPPPERRQNGQHVFEMVKNIHVVLGKKNADGMKRDRSTPPVPGVPGQETVDLLLVFALLAGLGGPPCH